MNKTIVVIDRISDCKTLLKPAKTPFFTPQASALAKLRYAPNHWSTDSSLPAPGGSKQEKT
jgi:hypothetical protein